jgi:hypothetical protein
MKMGDTMHDKQPLLEHPDYRLEDHTAKMAFLCGLVDQAQKAMTPRGIINWSNKIQVYWGAKSRIDADLPGNYVYNLVVPDNFSRDLIINMGFVQGVDFIKHAHGDANLRMFSFTEASLKEHFGVEPPLQTARKTRDDIKPGAGAVAILSAQVVADPDERVKDEFNKRFAALSVPEGAAKRAISVTQVEHIKGTIAGQGRYRVTFDEHGAIASSADMKHVGFELGTYVPANGFAVDFQEKAVEAAFLIKRGSGVSKG